MSKVISESDTPKKLVQIEETLAGSTSSSNSIAFTIRESEFLLRLIFNSKIDGEQLEIGAGVLSKVKELHNKLMEIEVEVNR